MSYIGTRIKLLRKTLGLSQEAFGKKIGITKASISRIEKEDRNPSEQTIKSICREFGVDYFWLTEGIGSEMFIKKETDPIKLVAQKYSLSDLDEKILTNFVKMPPNKREIMVNAFKELFENK